MKKLNYEIYADDDSFPYDEQVNSIRLSTAEVDGRLTFRTFPEARAALKAILVAREEELQEQLKATRYARRDLGALRVRHLRPMP